MTDNKTNLADFINSINTMPNVFKNITDNFARMADSIRESQLAALRMTDYFTNLNKAIANIVPDISKITDFVSSFQKFHEIEKRALIESGWFICPSLDPLPYHYISAAVVQYNSGRKDSITVLMKSLYGEKNWKYLEKTVNGWSSHKFFTKQRVKIINDALNAHKDGKYTLSIPALLPIVEGICGDFCKSQKVVVGKSASSKKAKAVLAKLKSNGEEYVSELVLEFIEKQLYVYTDSLKTSKNKKFLNRHGVLHGSYSGYADCARSLRCFLLLDVLTLL